MISTMEDVTTFVSKVALVPVWLDTDWKIRHLVLVRMYQLGLKCYCHALNIIIFPDIDECRRNNGGCQSVCSNLPGSYVCSCEPGFKLRRNGRSCSKLRKC